MDREPEELQFLGLGGILSESLILIISQRHRRLFSQITLSLIVPLSVLFLAHVHISHVLFHRIHSDEVALDNSTPNTPSSSALIADLSHEWALFLLFKSLYILALLVFSLLSTSAIVYSVASIFTAKSSADGDNFHKLLFTVVPKVWRRLMLTFLWAFLFLLAYHIASIFVIVAVFLLLGPYTLGITLVVLLSLAYLAGLVWISVVWHLASVISVLEDLCGVPAMKKSKELIRGKTLLACGIFLLLNLVFAVIEFGFKKLVVQGRAGGALGRFGLGLVLWGLLVGVILQALVVQTVMYFVCKSYHHESIDKSSLADHLEVYMGDYVPLKEKDVQMEQYA